MCYLNEYTCTIRCLNTDLNISAAMNGTIQSLRPYGDQCRVIACDFVRESSNGPMATGSGATLLQNNFWLSVLIGAGIALVFLGLYALWVIRKDNTHGPSTENKKDRDL